MRTRTLGSSDLVVSVVGLGCNNFGPRVDEAGSRAVIDAALDAGITFFDTAEMYGAGLSEEYLGSALAGRRDGVVVATKFGWGTGRDDTGPLGSAESVRTAIVGSLRRLRTDYVDLYQYHRPDGITPFEETLGALDELVREGKVRAVGSSNLSAAQVLEADAAAAAHGLVRFASAQNEYSWLNREAERDLAPACEQLGLGLIPFYPLARGLLTGKYRRNAPVPEGTRLSGNLDVPGETWDRLEAIEAFAEREGVGLLDVVIGGLAAQPAVASVIAGATRPEQARANASAGAWEPTESQLVELRSL